MALIDDVRALADELDRLTESAQRPIRVEVDITPSSSLDLALRDAANRGQLDEFLRLLEKRLAK